MLLVAIPFFNWYGKTFLPSSKKSNALYEQKIQELEEEISELRNKSAEAPKKVEDPYGPYIGIKEADRQTMAKALDMAGIVEEGGFTANQLNLLIISFEEGRFKINSSLGFGNFVPKDQDRVVEVSQETLDALTEAINQIQGQ